MAQRAVSPNHHCVCETKVMSKEVSSHGAGGTKVTSVLAATAEGGGRNLYGFSLHAFRGQEREGLIEVAFLPLATGVRSRKERDS
jgi:hypothetical protein